MTDGQEGGDKLGEVLSVPPRTIRRNDENPRLIFREAELDQLTSSIKEVGIQVPLTVYLEPKDQSKYVLIDGERRWRCALKLNMQKVPVLIQAKPTPLENLLLMFNIHNVRVQWDLYPTALKLQQIRELAKKERNIEPDEEGLSALTGLKLGTVRRALELLQLPQKYQDTLMEELKKPKKEQRLTEDFFLEMTRSVKVMEKYVPEIIEEVPRAEVLESFVQKFKTEVIDNRVKFRLVSRIARGARVGVAKDKILPVLRKLVLKKNYSIDDAYEETAFLAYKERELLTRIKGLNARIKELVKVGKPSDRVRHALLELSESIRTLFKK
jgi:ParB family chromosome partitioning protein